MAIEEKRKHPRVPTINLLSFASLDEQGYPLEQSMGKALDIGQGGLLMETQVPVGSHFIMLTATNADEELINIKGRVIYSRQVKPKIFHTGIRFIETDERNKDIFKDMIKAFIQTKAD